MNKVTTFLAFLTLGLWTLAAQAQIMCEGDFGENNSQHYAVSADGTLTISGIGVLTEPLRHLWFCSQSFDKIVIEEGITSINSFVLSGLNEVKTILLPNSVTVIKEWAFSSLRGLISIEIPAGVTEVGYCAFEGCSALQSITFHCSEATFGYGLFWGCSSLVSVEFADGLTEIPNTVFSGCSALTSVRIPSTVKKIGVGAFEGCSALASIDLPNDLVEIGQNAFSGCSSLTSVVLPSSLKTIDNYAFMNSLASVSIPAGVDSIGTGAFGGEKMAAIEVDAGNARYSSQDGVLYNKAKTTLLQYPAAKTGTNFVVPQSVSIIGLAAFSYSKTTSVKLPAGLIEIGTGAFSNSAISSIEIPRSVSVIGNGAFASCKNLTAVVYPDYVTTIGWNIFENCTGLTSITIMPGVTEIATLTFSQCTGLTSIVIPESVVTIGISAFSGCTGLTSVVIPENVAMIEASAFSGCTNLAEITLPATTTVGTNAFSGTAWFDNQPDGVIYINQVLYKYKGVMPDNTTITVRPGTKVISGYAFSYCTGLVAIEFSEEVEVIKEGVFVGCSNLEALNFPKSLKIIEGMTYSSYRDLTKITSLYIPENVESIGIYAFVPIPALEAINVDQANRTYSSIDGVLYNKEQTMVILCPRAKQGSVFIPETVNYFWRGVWSSAFMYPQNLTSIVCPKDTPPIFALLPPEEYSTILNDSALLNESFAYPAENTILYVPAGSIAAYQAADGWKQFNDIRQMQSMIVAPNPSGSDNSGRIDLALNVPQEVAINGGTFTVALPEGMTIDEDKTALVEELIAGYTMTITKNDDGTWSFVIEPKTGLRSATATEYRRIATIAYTVAGTVADGAYQATVSALRFEFADGSTVVQEEMPVVLRVDHSFQGIETPDAAAIKVVKSGRGIEIDSPATESITVYSISGAILSKAAKPAGQTLLSLEGLAEQVLIVKGSSGWVKKVR